VPVTIPDDDELGIINSMVLADAGRIADLNLVLELSHTYVSDLRIVLEHVETGTETLALDPSSCPADDIDAILDDEAGGGVGSACASEPPAIFGNFAPVEPLSAFDDEAIAGVWRLRVVDEVAEDTGTLDGWCLQFNADTPRVTSITCNGQPACTVVYGASFGLAFRVEDLDGDASSWSLVRRSAGGEVLATMSGNIVPATANREISLPLSIVCPQVPCAAADQVLEVAAGDTLDLLSPARTLTVHLVPGP
jgi:subtilisin-like proprotein convertase family protein